MIIIDCKNRKIEACLKKYRQKVDRIGTLNELKDRKNFEKPSVKRRRTVLSAKYKNKKYGNPEL